MLTGVNSTSVGGLITRTVSAEKGISAAKNPLEGKNGLYHQYYQARYDPSVLVDGLGSEFRCLNITFKPYPSCRGTHASIDAALKLVKRHDIVPEEVEEIRLTVGPSVQGKDNAFLGSRDASPKQASRASSVCLSQWLRPFKKLLMS